ncbi:ubiquitin 3 binding protein But2 C-terminal domain-containing protein [Aspergillus transmontanensis]|uniref:Ubiquitin 3 binding protein But2 C-terminal domain-containing protein n=1 Tax=Aspergillus transmontanensis TaxID=1034304 RepID=A0A5N6W592_9EURO|nr:ubiquitin 3 binding protein But2 C-terminal domain-containing protein [Aspergillus transmontanensis]
MKSLFVTLAAFAASTQALTGRTTNCCFHLTASGGASGTVGQLTDGQNRIGDHSLSTAQFCISSDGSITDGSGRGCILTPPTTQFQCDQGATPESGFSISPSGMLEFQGSSEFLACDTGQNGGRNIHVTPSKDLGQCVIVELKADSCAPSASTAPSATPSSSKSCPTTLSSGNFEFPHLIIPVDSVSPNTAFGTSFNGKVTSTISSIFNFDIPQADSGKMCNLVFLFPQKADLQTSSFSFSGDGKINFSKLSKAATTSTTFKNAPSTSQDLGDITISPGHSFVVSTFSCPAGEAIAFQMKNAGTTDLDFFEDFNPPPESVDPPGHGSLCPDLALNGPPATIMGQIGVAPLYPSHVTYPSPSESVAMTTCLNYKRRTIPSCKGSSNSPSITDCQEAIRRIDEGSSYGDGAEFSVGNCYMVYATNGDGEHKVEGKTIRNTAQSILDSCGHHKGSYGTNNNCDSCHVTINYRAPK